MSPYDDRCDAARQRPQRRSESAPEFRQTSSHGLNIKDFSSGFRFGCRARGAASGRAGGPGVGGRQRDRRRYRRRGPAGGAALAGDGARHRGGDAAADRVRGVHGQLLQIIGLLLAGGLLLLWVCWKLWRELRSGRLIQSHSGDADPEVAEAVAAGRTEPKTMRQAVIADHRGRRVDVARQRARGRGRRARPRLGARRRAWCCRSRSWGSRPR